MTARELGWINLLDALQLLALLTVKDPRRGERAKARWLRRYLEADPAAGLRETATVIGRRARCSSASWNDATRPLPQVLVLGVESVESGRIGAVRLTTKATLLSATIVAVIAPSAAIGIRVAASPSPQPARSSPYVGGNASPRFPAGAPHVLSVVARGPYSQEVFGKCVGCSVPIIVRNNTNRTVIRIAVSGTASTPGGKLLATGSDQGLHPNVVKPGETAFGYVFFHDAKLPADAGFHFKLTSTAPADAQFENIRDLIVAESHGVQDSVLGTFRNAYPVKVTGPIEVTAACFSAAGKLLYIASDFTDQDQVAAKQTLPFQVDTTPPYRSTGLSCPVYLVAGSGF
jgi:hypothetical protein